MNVVFDPWIPVVDLKGKPELISLEDVFIKGKKYADLAVRPHERVAVMRLLICIAHAALDGPKDYKEWQQVPKKLPEAARMYLEKWKDSFELFHKTKPWLQVADLKGVEKDGDSSGTTSPVTLLDFELATGHNSTLFDHDGQNNSRQIEVQRIVLSLLTFQNFSSGGGSPIAQWKEVKTKQVGNPDAPCLSQSMAHCLFRGESLADTIYLNIPTYVTVVRVYKNIIIDKKKEVRYSEVALGKPIWENFPESPKIGSESVQNATRTYLGRLVPISRWIRLLPNSDQMYCSNGFKYETYRGGFAAEPTAAVRLVTKRDKKGSKIVERDIVKADPNKALWRELSSIIIKRSVGGLGGPLAMENVSNGIEFDFHVCAITRDQASMDIVVESVFHITSGIQGNINIYQVEVKNAETIESKLNWAIEIYRKEIDGSWEKKLEKAKSKFELKNKLAFKAALYYWTSVENNLSLLMKYIEALGTDDIDLAHRYWKNMLWNKAREAYQVACGIETPRHMRAFSLGWQKLTSQKEVEDSFEKKEEAYAIS